METIWSALIGAVFGFAGALLTLWLAKKELYAKTVSANRMAWINVWRENLSKMLACAELLHSHTACAPRSMACKNQNIFLQAEKDFYEARGMLAARLNLAEQDHKAMLLLLNNLQYDISAEEFVKQREAILALGRKILKPEWERIKKEA